MDYRDVEGQFDRISSVGLIEHLGTPHYPGLLRHMHRAAEARRGDVLALLRPDGRGPGMTDKWTRKYIFPGGYIPALSELVTEARSNRLIVADVEAMRYHYAHTLEEWYHRTDAAREEIVELYDERFYPHVAILSGRRRGRLPLWRDGQLADPVSQAPRRDADDPRLYVQGGRATART